MKKLIEMYIEKGNGSHRFYQNEGWDIEELMEIMRFLDKDQYSFGKIENNNGLFVEVIRF